MIIYGYNDTTCQIKPLCFGEYREVLLDRYHHVYRYGYKELDVISQLHFVCKRKWCVYLWQSNISVTLVFFSLRNIDNGFWLCHFYDVISDDIIKGCGLPCTVEINGNYQCPLVMQNYYFGFLLCSSWITKMFWSTATAIVQFWDWKFSTCAKLLFLLSTLCWHTSTWMSKMFWSTATAIFSLLRLEVYRCTKLLFQQSTLCWHTSTWTLGKLPSTIFSYQRINVFLTLLIFMMSSRMTSFVKGANGMSQNKCWLLGFHAYHPWSV